MADAVEISTALDGVEQTAEPTETTTARLGPSIEVQSLWFASVARPWRSLALVPASAELDLGQLAEDLFEAATRAGAGVRLLDARAMTLDEAPFLLARLAAFSHESARVLVALPHPNNQPAARALLEASDSFLLFVPLGELPARSVQLLVEICPRGRGLGAVAVHRKRGRNRASAARPPSGGPWR
ncbi:MAG TPA: hypothetical protein VE782_07925 [Myxococcaceae bacterium]|nr:hypothetical protein [Myxococcaceae bacterium]